MEQFRLFPVAASAQAAHTDGVFWLLFWASAAVVVLVAGLLLVFCIRYRRGKIADHDPLPEVVSREFEIGWTVATLFAFLFFFWWASSTELRAFTAPRDALEIHIIGKQWMWQAEHPNGAREIDELHLPLGEPVRLVMTSQDVIHDFYIPAFRVKQDVLPGQFTDESFTPTRVGEYRLFCAEYCGTDHARMGGRIVVMPPEDYAAWAAAQPQGDLLARQGEALFQALGCSGCHAPRAAVHAPDLHGLYGSPVPLADGTVVTADDAYLRDSILQPRRAVAAGYQPIMPSFAGEIGNDELLQLVAYIKSLKGRDEAAVQEGTP